MNRILIALAFMLLLSLVPAAANASGISDRLESSLNAMVNYTPPGVHDSNRRTVISGGSLAVKLQTGRVDAFGFRAPSISVGCGGIDAFFGAFSMVSKEVVVQALRAIVTGVLQYAFRVALKVLCQSCEQLMGTIGDALAKANQYLGDMCNATNNFLESRLSTDDAALKVRAQMGLTSTGAADDANEARQAGSWASSLKDFVDKMPNPPGRAELPEFGNHLYNAIKDAEGNVFHFLGPGTTFYDELMSVIGTKVVCSQDIAAHCPGKVDGPGVTSSGQAGETYTNTYDPSLTFDFLVNGAADRVDAAGDSIPREFWKCNDTGGEYPCLAPQPASLDGYVSVRQRMENAFLGADGSSGILYKMRYRYTEALTPEEELWMRSGGNVVGMLVDLSAKDYNTAVDFLMEYSEFIAADFTYSLLIDSIIKVRQSLAEQPTDRLAEQREMVQRSVDTIRADYIKIQERAQTKGVAFDAYLARRNALAAGAN